MLRRVPCFVACTLPLAIVLLWTMPVSGQYGTQNGEWRYYGGDAGSTRYSPLDQINKDNVRDLQIAWRWKTENFGPRPEFNYEATPLMVGGVLYTTAGSRRDVLAIDGATGETLWMFRYDEGVRGQKAPIRSASGRGVAYWTDGKEARILHVTPGYHLFALDAKTGRPIPSFGKDGVVDLYEGLDRRIPQDGQIGWNTPPLVVRDAIVVGAALGSSLTKEFVAGSVRGYDVRTGKRMWIFHTIPRPGEFGNETWENDSWSYTGHTGVWASISADEELGYVYLPVEAPTNDMYGGHRPGDNVFAESLVCLDAKTGKHIWHYQLVHHPIWDYDIPAAPILVDITVGGKPIKAVVQLTKQAFAYVFDRVTGQPVWPIEERPVPQSDVPGEKTSLTQPFPTKPAPFDRQGVTLDDLLDFTPELKAEAIKIASQYRMGPLFTPPSMSDPKGTKGTLTLPAGLGGANWPGGAVDPETGILYIPSVTATRISQVRSADPKRSNMNFTGGWVTGFGGVRAGGAGVPRDALPPLYRDGGPQGLPLIKPPWGRITAIDLNTGDHVWMVPNGDTPEHVKKHPALKGVVLSKTGQAGRAGVLLTKTLLFAGEGGGLFSSPPGSGGPMLRAFDKRSGEVISEFTLPGNQTGVPMTYVINGKQYIVVAVGAPNQPAELVALSVP
jgi:quinoprotein glucose dehydrogenase